MRRRGRPGAPPPAGPSRWLRASCSPPSPDAAETGPGRVDRPGPASRPRSPSNPAAATSSLVCAKAGTSFSSAMRRPRRPRTTPGPTWPTQGPSGTSPMTDASRPGSSAVRSAAPGSGGHGAGQPIGADPGDRRAGLRSGSRARDTGPPERGLPQHRRRGAGPPDAAPVRHPTARRTEHGARLPPLQPPGSDGTLDRGGRGGSLRPRRRRPFQRGRQNHRQGMADAGPSRARRPGSAQNQRGGAARRAVGRRQHETGGGQGEEGYETSFQTGAGKPDRSRASLGTPGW